MGTIIDVVSLYTDNITLLTWQHIQSKGKSREKSTGYESPIKYVKEMIPQMDYHLWYELLHHIANMNQQLHLEQK